MDVKEKVSTRLFLVDYSVKQQYNAMFLTVCVCVCILG